MKKTLLSAVSAFAIFVAGGMAFAQDQSTSDTNGAPTTQEDSSTSGAAGSGDATTGTSDSMPETGGAGAGAADDSTDSSTDDLGTGSGSDQMDDAGSDTDLPSDTGTTGTGTIGGAATGDDAGTTMPEMGDDDTTSGLTDTTTPTDFSQLHPYDGDPTGIDVEGVPAEDIVGGTLVNQEGDSIASINDLLVDSNGEPQALLVGFGGFLGLMEKTVAVGFDRVELTANEDNEYVTDLTEQEIEAMPEYEEPEA